MSSAAPIALWGGPECTVNRVGDRHYDQLERTGHAHRIDDLDRFAELGLHRIRYPLLWERTAPADPDHATWDWADQRMARLRSLGLNPVVGLTHHGSGPMSTSLLDPTWGERLAGYAGAVARRYPWVDAFTPVNEPLTTARFSALYGHWYPHARDDRSFARALCNQIRGTVLAMRAIREVNPAAELIQTEDLGFTRSTDRLQYQADFENERRWLTFDLLSGRVTRGHPLYDFLRAAGIAPAELGWFHDNPCSPGILGLNYYVTSERYLDDTHPDGARSSGNGRDRYVDCEAVRRCGLVGITALLQQASARYGVPVAITEAHLAGTRDEQMRWLLYIWDGAHAASEAGVTVRAVTAWSLLGAYDWDSLCTRCEGRYESGVFDVRGGVPRPTALATMVRELARGRRPAHPVLAAKGWWQQ
jgi:dTDP-4-dehydrorhamnose reductase